MCHPVGWEVRFDDASGRVELAGPGGERAVMWPVFVPGGLSQEAAGTVLVRLAARLVPEATWGQTLIVGPGAVRAVGRAGGTVAVGIFAWVQTPRGVGGTLYLVAGPPTLLRDHGEDLSRILSSFCASGPAVSAPAAPAVAYTRWTDPHEGAFSLEVPTGWTVRGGVFRAAPVDTRTMAEVSSPDATTLVFLGDWELPTFTEPTPILLMTGFPEGSWYSPGYGVTMMVRRYVPGLEFAREYVLTKVARSVSGVKITLARERSDVADALNAVYAQYGQVGVSIRWSAGEVCFTGLRDGRATEGYCFASTRLVQPAGMAGALWNAEYLGGFLTSPDKRSLTEEILSHMVQSVQLNPQWVAVQQHIAGEASRIVSRTHQDISRLLHESFQHRQQTYDELARRRSNVILDVEDVIDPSTGRQLKVESGANYYWLDHRGTIVGTETHTRPALEFRELIRLP